MAANEYYNSFNGGTPQMMNTQPASTYAPSATGTAPPPYQEYHPQGFPPGHPAYQQPPAPQPHSQHPYNIADFKHNYDPRINYGPSTPPPSQQRPTFQPSQSQVHFEPQPTYYSPAPSPRPHRPARVNTHASSSSPSPPPQPQRPGRERHNHHGMTSISTTNLKPQRSSSEPPSPYYERRPSQVDERRRRRHHHHHHRHHHDSSSRSRSRSRSRDRYGKVHEERDRESKAKPKNAEKNTFLGALGGSVIGDLIFPGLGTIGGAVLGGWGGHEASKKKQDRMKGRSYSDRPEESSRKNWRGGRRSYEEEWEEGRRRRGEY